MSRTPAPSRPTLVVLESAPEFRPTTNPYLIQLVEALRGEPGVEVQLFSFGRALLARYDVFHVHWPESLLTANSALKRWRRRILTLLLLERIRITRTALVRTWHNLDRPESLGRFDSFILDEFDRLTTLRIALNPLSDFPDDKPSVVIPHGHYRDWYGRQQPSEAVPGRISYVGLIRRYKGVESLVSAFRALRRPESTLRIAGKPSTTELSETLLELAGDDQRISFDFRFLDDADFVKEITQGSLVVLPYRHMHNSGVTLAALSLDRPALVPDNELNHFLAEEVGQGWLFFFAGELDAVALAAAVTALEDSPPSGRPNLDARSWASAGRAHAAAFRRATQLRHSRRRA